MSIQYVVFSTIFKNTIPNFPVYLMTGIVLFNYFSEATSLGPVSYTHLDVYKRQFRKFSPPLRIP